MEKRTDAKKQIAEALKTIQRKKLLDRITVSEIAAQAGINRSTFYYHFSDIFQLLEWILEEEIVSKYSEVTPEQWMDNTLLFLRTIRGEISFYRQMLRLEKTMNLRSFFWKMSSGNVSHYIDSYLQGRVMRPETRQKIVDFYTAGLVELYLRYIEAGARQTPERMMLYLYDLAEPQLRMTIDRSIQRDAEPDATGINPIQTGKWRKR